MKTSLGILAAVILFGVAGCTSGDGQPMDASPTTTSADSSTVRPSPGSSEPMAVDDLVGARWSGPDDGAAPSSTLHVIRGPGHCDWESSVWLHLAWPVGTEAGTSGDIHQYVRDPRGVLPDEVEKQASLELDSEVPDTAEPTGYHVDGVELWLGDDGRDEAVYVVFEDHVERWPRTAEVIACA